VRVHVAIVRKRESGYFFGAQQFGLVDALFSEHPSTLTLFWPLIHMYFLLRTLFLLGSIHLLLVTSTPISSPDVLDTPPLPDRDDLVHWLDPQIAFQSGNGWSDLEVRNILDAASFNTPSNHSLVPRKTPTNKPHSKNAKQSKSSRPLAKGSATNTLDAAIQAVFNILKGVGDAIGVVITWCVSAHASSQDPAQATQVHRRGSQESKLLGTKCMDAYGRPRKYLRRTMLILSLG
jgi:hypothetical protein